MSQDEVVFQGSLATESDLVPPSAQPPVHKGEEREAAVTIDAKPLSQAIENARNAPLPSQHHSLKHHLLGPSLTKAGQDEVDQKKVAEIIYEASKGSKYFNNAEAKDKTLTVKIENILRLKAQLDKLDLKHDLRRADAYITEQELSRDLSQYIVHIDCDAFYAAVEEIDRPELKNVPMAVGQGVLTTCNYEARKYGCRSAMAGFVAMKLCPQLICLPLNFDKYTAKAREVRAVLSIYDPRFESSSIDEAYLNITEYCDKNDMTPDMAVSQLRQQVHDECQVTISAGIAPNAKIAKICSNKNKPNGQFRIHNDRLAVMSFVRDLPVRKVNGVGRVLERELDAIGIKTCGNIYEFRAYLNRLFGEKTSHFLLQTYLGLGRTDISPAEDHERKSVGTESTFRDLSNREELREKLKHTAASLEEDMKRVGVKGRTLVLKVKLHTYEVFTRQVVTPKAVSQAEDLYKYGEPMLARLEKEIPNMTLRLMGLRCTNLIEVKKPDLDEFFSRKPGTSVVRSQSAADDGEWETWPKEEFEHGQATHDHTKGEVQRVLARQGAVPDPRLNSSDSAVLNTSNETAQTQVSDTADWHEPFGRYKYGSTSDGPAASVTTANGSTPEAELWNCPICLGPQPAEDRTFNEHVDLCLSRGAIRDSVSQIAEQIPDRSASTHGWKRKPDGPDMSKERGAGARQRKLFFA